jgi:hypothetical protein
MNQLNTLAVSIGAMSNTRVVISCVDYNHEILSVSDFQEHVVEQLVDFYHNRLCQNLALVRSLEKIGISKRDINHHKMGLCDRTLHQHVASSRTFEGASVRVEACWKYTGCFALPGMKSLEDALSSRYMTRMGSLQGFSVNG